jgi:hypothetical protein
MNRKRIHGQWKVFRFNDDSQAGWKDSSHRLSSHPKFSTLLLSKYFGASRIQRRAQFMGMKYDWFLTDHWLNQTKKASEHRFTVVLSLWFTYVYSRMEKSSPYCSSKQGWEESCCALTFWHYLSPTFKLKHPPTTHHTQHASSSLPLTLPLAQRAACGGLAGEEVWRNEVS